MHPTQSLSFTSPPPPSYYKRLESLCSFVTHTNMREASLSASQLWSQMPRGETRTRRRRRRRRKVKGDAKKRRLSDEQVRFLEMSFRDESKLASGRKAHLAAELGLDGKQVAVWFQNRRARHKNKQLEEAYLKLKLEHEAVVIEKCHLENEVLQLKEKLLEAEEEIRSVNGGNLGSSFSAVSLQPILGEYGTEEEAELAYMDEYDFYNYTMEWTNPYGI